MDRRKIAFDVAAVGEVLIDFTPAGNDACGDRLFVRKPGGAPANVLAAVSKLGGRTAFIGKIGNDMFGSFLKETLDHMGIDTSGLAVDKTIHTTLAFVQLDDKGDRSFSFYRNPGADVRLEAGEIPQDIISQSHMLHFGSVSLTDEPSRSATLHAVNIAKKAGCIISYDPNYRPPLWGDIQEAKTQMMAGLSMADIVKVSEEEMVLLTGKTDLEEGSFELGKHGAALVLISLGAQGAFFRRGDFTSHVPTYDVKTVDTNGAGDAFLGAVNFCIKECSLNDLSALSKHDLEEIVSFANAAGALTTSKNGAIPAMPTVGEIENCRRSIPIL